MISRWSETQTLYRPSRNARAKQFTLPRTPAASIQLRPDASARPSNTGTSETKVGSRSVKSVSASVRTHNPAQHPRRMIC